jgi:hypothetical protein
MSAPFSLALAAIVTLAAAPCLMSQDKPSDERSPSGGNQKKSEKKQAGKAVAMPAWRKGLPFLKPFTIPGTRPDANKVMSHVQFGFSGAAAEDTDSKAAWYSLAAGGHFINNVNAVFKIDFMLDRPAWTLDCPPSTDAIQAAAGAAVPNPAYHSDGLPASGHTYWYEWAVPTRDVAIRVRLCATHPLSENKWNSDVYNITKKQWVLPGGTAFPAGVAGYGGEINFVSVMAQDPRTYDLYYHNGSNVARFTVEKWQWENFGSPAPGDQQWSYAPGFIDTKLERFAIIVGDRANSGARISYQDLKTRAFGNIPIVADKDHGLPYMYEYNGGCYDPDNHLYWYAAMDRKNEANSLVLWSIDPSSGQATCIGTVAGPGGGGPCSRFAYFRALKGIVYQPSGAEAVFIPTK